MLWSSLKDEYVTDDVGRTGVASKEIASTYSQRCEGLGYCRRWLGRMLGIWVPFMVLPFAHDVLSNRPTGTRFLFQLTLTVKLVPSHSVSSDACALLEGWRQVIYSHC